MCCTIVHHNETTLNRISYTELHAFFLHQIVDHTSKCILLFWCTLQCIMCMFFFSQWNLVVLIVNPESFWKTNVKQTNDEVAMKSNWRALSFTTIASNNAGCSRQISSQMWWKECWAIVLNSVVFWVYLRVLFCLKQRTRGQKRKRVSICEEEKIEVNYHFSILLLMLSFCLICL